MRTILFIVWNAVVLGMSLYSVFAFQPTFDEGHEFALLQDVVVSFMFLPSVFILLLGLPSLLMIKTARNPWFKLAAIVLIGFVLIICVNAILPYSLQGNLILCFIAFIYSMVYLVVAFALVPSRGKRDQETEIDA